MRRILTLLFVAVLGVATVYAQTSESKRKPKPTTTQTTAPKPAPKPVQATAPKPAPKPVTPNIESKPANKPTTAQSSTPQQKNEEDKSASNKTSIHKTNDFSSSKTNNTPKITKETFTVKGISFDMVRVEEGSFIMGAFDESEKSHSVHLKSFLIGETEVTQELWIRIMEKNPSKFKNNSNPVERVSWNDCQEFIRKLNQLTGKKFRLPTEAEWEYAARGGNLSQGHRYSGSNNIDDVAWYCNNSGDKRTNVSFSGSNSAEEAKKYKNNNCQPHPVKQKLANELGIYDMSGNVFEWCSDWWDEYSATTQSNPTGPSNGKFRIFRGGSWFWGAMFQNNASLWFDGESCKVSNRFFATQTNKYPFVGLRLVLSE